jgi:hypothetical protein
MDCKEFKINEFLSLELWAGKTFIYVSGKKFRQCKYVLLNMSADDINQHISIDSIDDILYDMDHSLEENPKIIPPKVEFWAHCSNLQAWAENDYNTDLLDSVLSFPLLKELTVEGDLKAKRVFKEEIAKRMIRGELRTAGYLIDIGYLKYLTEEELNSLFSSEDSVLFENIFNVFQKDDLESLSEATRIYDTIGKYLFNQIKRKTQEALDERDLNIIFLLFNYRLLDKLSDKDILTLFNQPMNLLEKILEILNEIDIGNVQIIEYGLFSEKIEEVLGDKIREILLKTIVTSKIKYDVLWKLNLLKYLKKEDIKEL